MKSRRVPFFWNSSTGFGSDKAANNLLMYSTSIWRSTYLLKLSPGMSTTFMFELNIPDIKRSMSLESIASPVAIDPYICTLAFGHSITIKTCFITCECLSDLDLDPSDYACPLSFDACQLVLECLLKLVHLLINPEVELLFPHLNLVHLHVLILCHVRHLALSASSLIPKVVPRTTTVVSCGRWSVALKGEFGEKGLQESCVGMRVTLLLLLMVEGG